MKRPRRAHACLLILSQAGLGAGDRGLGNRGPVALSNECPPSSAGEEKNCSMPGGDWRGPSLGLPRAWPALTAEEIVQGTPAGPGFSSNLRANRSARNMAARRRRLLAGLLGCWTRAASRRTRRQSMAERGQPGQSASAGVSWRQLASACASGGQRRQPGEQGQPRSGSKASKGRAAYEHQSDTTSARRSAEDRRTTSDGR